MVVSLWHGMPIKCVGRLNTITPNPYPTFGMLHFATSHLFKYVMACAFAVRPEAVRICGSPRCDALLHDNPLKTGKAEVKSLLGIAPERKLVLWMPTYRTEKPRDASSRQGGRSFLDDIPAWVLDALSRAAVSHNCAIVVKLHGWDSLNDLALPFDYRNIELLRAQDWLRHGVQLYDLVAASDALISDVSSVLIDYLVTSRPIGVLGFDETARTRDLALPIELLAKSSRFTQLRDEAAIDEFLSRVVSGRQSTLGSNDISRLLYEDFELPGSESVLREAGL
jgi:CDP-glycerol glycerophosphotransferase (TagB/SpsB family)